jgi:hypothetical protein
MQAQNDSSKNSSGTGPLMRQQSLGEGMQLPDTAMPLESPVFRFNDGEAGTGSEIGYTNPNSVPSLFQGHALQPVNSNPIPLPRRTPDWFTLTLIFVIIAFAWIRVFYSKIFKQLINAFFSNSISNQVVRDENILVQRASILMSFVFYLTGSLFIYQVSVFFNWDYPFLGEGFLRFLVVCLIVAFAYSFKMVLLKAMGEVFELDRPVASYIFNIFLIFFVSGRMAMLRLLPRYLTGSPSLKVVETPSSRVTDFICRSLVSSHNSLVPLLFFIASVAVPEIVLELKSTKRSRLICSTTASSGFENEWISEIFIDSFVDFTGCVQEIPNTITSDDKIVFFKNGAFIVAKIVFIMPQFNSRRPVQNTLIKSHTGIDRIVSLLNLSRPSSFTSYASTKRFL